MPEVARADMQAGWTTVSLGDVVEVINDYWDRDTTIPERLVAGEHIDEGDMRIRRWGMTDDDLIPPTFNRRFQARDALLHSRNIDKVAQPDFGGITGEKIFILRSKDEDSLLQELIPYLVASDHFRHYAESRWAGSTNKFLNKTPLMQYEFALPPLEEQRRIVEVLQAAESAVEATQDAARVSSLSLAAAHKQLVESQHKCKKARLRDLCQPDAPLCYGVIQPGNDVAEGIPLLRVCDIENESIDHGELKRIAPEIDATYERSRVKTGDLLVSIVGTIGRIFIATDAEQGFNIARAIARIRMREECRPKFAAAVLLSQKYQRLLVGESVETARKTLNLSALGEIEVPVPSLEIQDHWVEVLNSIERGRRHIENRASQLRDLKGALLIELGGGSV